MALIFAEGFDDYSNPTDFGLSSAASSGVTATTGRTGSGTAAAITGAAGLLTYNVPASAAAQLYAGFAMTASGIDGAGAVARVQFLSNGAPLFSIVQASTNTLLFFDATNAVTASAYGPAINLVTGRIGSAVYKNFASYVEVELIPGNPGSVTVTIDGVAAFSATGNFSSPLTATLNQNNISTGATSFPVVADLGQAVPFLFTLGVSPFYGGSTTGRCTAKSGTGNVDWTCDPLPGVTNFNVGTPVTVYPVTGTSVQAVSFSCASNLTTGTPVLTVDDFYMCDPTGAQNNSFLGNTRILSQPPTGDGSDLNWTPSSGTAHWSLVNAYPINYGATEVTATAAGNQDTYTYPALPGLGNFTIMRAMQTAVYCESQGGGGANTIAGLVNIAGTNYPGSAQPTPAVWQRVATIFELDPATGLAWTGPNANGAQFGQKRTA
jgi:hypothetical protein